MAKKRGAVVSVDDLDGESVLDTVSLDAAVSVDEIPATPVDVVVNVATPSPEIPPFEPESYKEHCPTDPDWTEYVLSKLSPEELSPEGRPTCDGLRSGRTGSWTDGQLQRPHCPSAQSGKRHDGGG